jgi:uncharacterized protein YjbI with pentapeptide repeats
MNERASPSVVRAAGLSALCGYWAWAVLASPDFKVVLEGRLRLPLAGMDVASGVFFVVAPLVAFAAFFVVRSKARTGGQALVLFPAVLLLNASRCLKLHDPVLSYLAAGTAFVGIAWTFWTWAASRPFRGSWASAWKILAAAGFAISLAIEGVLVLFLIPWSLRGDLPGNMNWFPFSPALRSVLYANLAGYERPFGTRPKSLRGLHLEGADMRKAILRGTDLRNAQLYRARLDWADLEGADLRGARLVEALLSFVNLRNADLSGADMGGCYLMGANLRGVILRRARLPSLSLLYVDAEGADFSESDLTGVHLFGADLRNARLEGAIIKNSRLTRAVFAGADLRRADLQGANFFQADLRGASFEGANLVAAVDLTSDQLATVKTLYGARMGPDLLKQVQERCPHLLKKPAPVCAR